LRNFFNKTSKYQLDWPYSFQAPGIKYDSVPSSHTSFRHQDILQRVHQSSSEDDRYIDPGSGRVNELIVQCTDRVYSGPNYSTYKRTFIRNVAPKTLRIANWPMNHLDYGPESEKSWELLLMVLKWPLTCCLLYTIVGSFYICNLSSNCTNCISNTSFTRLGFRVQHQLARWLTKVAMTTSLTDIGDIPR
jgi:hypothetical protein